MKVWGKADPRLLNRKHLLGEHNEIHTLLKGGWPNHPESLQRRFGGDVSWVIFRHELVRHAMAERWPANGHLEHHGSPVDAVTLTDAQVYVLELYVHWPECGPQDDVVQQCYDFQQLMREVGFPPITGGMTYDTPWCRDYMTVEQYVALGDTWEHDTHKLGGAAHW